MKHTVEQGTGMWYVVRAKDGGRAVALFHASLPDAGRLAHDLADRLNRAEELAPQGAAGEKE